MICSPPLPAAIADIASDGSWPYLQRAPHRRLQVEDCVDKTQPTTHHLTSIKQQAPSASLGLYLAHSITSPTSFYFELDVAPKLCASIPSKVRHQPFSLALHTSNSKISSTQEREAVCL